MLIASGPRAAEALLFGAIAREIAAARANPRLLAQPVRVIVPSRSLREHVAAKLAQAHVGVAGVVVQTLRGFARELLRRADLPDLGRGGELLLPVLVRRHAREYEALREVLSALDEGYAPVVESVRDLLDAGLDEASAEAAAEALAAEDGAEAARARAVLALALRVVRELEALGVSAPAALFARVSEAIAEAPAAAHARALWIHGYADVTGVQLDLLERLVTHAGARAIVDQPPDPTGGGGVGEFTLRLRTRLAAGAPPAEAPALPSPPALLRAPGAQAEARAVAERIRALLDAAENPVAPEAIAVVARNLAPYRFALATHLRRMGVAFTGGPGTLDPAGRRLAALLTLVEEGERAPTDRWLDAADLRRRAGEASAGLALVDLRLALHALGRGRIAEVARLDVASALGERKALALPARARLVGGDDGDAEPRDEESAVPADRALRAERRSISAQSLAWARDDAGRALAGVRALAAAATLGARAERLRALCKDALRWRHDTPGRSALEAALAGLERDLRGDLALDSFEFRLLLARALERTGIAALGGQGGGVQVLSVTAARARTFSHLFVLGLERDVFPRTIREDPLLPDRVRRRLEAVLPDVPLKARGHDEERFLFAQLCGAADHVQLSWQETSDDGKERAASPLVQRLRIAHGLAADPPAAPPVFAARDAPRPAHEHAVLAGFARDRAGAERASALALAPRLAALAEPAARARAASLAFRDALRPPLSPGPHLGQIGPVLAGTRALAVTRLEAMAYCPWQAFLEKLLGLEPAPDALAALPELSPLLLGNAVHGALEEIAKRAGVPVEVSFADVRSAPPLPVTWPAPRELEEIALRAAREAAEDDGVVLPGFAELLARRARALLERARELDWPSGVRVGVRAAEVACEVLVEVPGDTPLRLTCRADRLDYGAAGWLLTDYKTGRPISDKKQEKTRRAAFLRAIEEGKKLQAAAYASAAGEPALGRYLFLKPDASDEHVDVRVASDDAEAITKFREAAVRQIVRWRSGDLMPALVGSDPDDEGPSCKFCRVSEACWKDDAGARRWVHAVQAAAGAASAEPEDAEES